VNYMLSNPSVSVYNGNGNFKPELFGMASNCNLYRAEWIMRAPWQELNQNVLLISSTDYSN